MASAAVRSWRTAFSQLRESVSSLEDLFSLSKVLVSASTSLPPQEVVEDLLFLANLVSSESSIILDYSHKKCSCYRACCLIMDINSCTPLNAVPIFVPSVLLFLEKFIQICSCSSKDIPLQESIYTETENCYVESLQALRQIIHEYGDDMSASDATRVTAFLLRYIKCPAFPLALASGSQSDQACGGFKNRQLEMQGLVFATLGNLFSRPGIPLSSSIWHEVVKTFREFLEAVTMLGRLVEDLRFSRFYATMLHCVQLVLTNGKGSIADHVGGLVTTLHRFFAYGLGIDRSAIHPSPAVNISSVEPIDKTAPTKTVYRPPHIRRSLTRYLPQDMQNNCSSPHISEPESGKKVFSSDSEQSDSEGSTGDRDRFKSSKVRVSALLCMQALARADAKSLHAYWVLLFPTHDALNVRRLQSTLLNIALLDPVLKVRMAALFTISLMLEQPSRAFMQVAEYKEPGKFGSFMTLSWSLGQILVQLQRGLSYLVQNETNIGLLVASLKALSLFVAAAPFNRLPNELLPNIIYALQKRLKELCSSSADETNAVCVALGCLGHALNTAPSSYLVATMLSDEISGARTNCQLLHDLVTFTEMQMAPLVRVEALQALKWAVHNYPSVMVQYWVPASSIFKKTIESLQDEHPAGAFSTSLTSSADIGRTTSDGKADYAAVKLLDEFLRAVSGSQFLEETQDDITLKSFSPALPTECLSSSSCVSSFSESYSMEKDKTNIDCAISLWNESLQNYLPIMIKHSTGLVRGGALNCFAGLTCSVFFGLPESQQSFILDTVWQAAVQNENPSARSAACRAIGVLITFPGLITRKDVLICTVNRIMHSTSDASVMVRITASWALANVCDALRSAFEKGSLDFNRCTSLTVLAERAIKLSKDGDKVRANAVRTLGNLAKFINFGQKMVLKGRSLNSDAEDVETGVLNQGTDETFPWLERMVQTLVWCATTGNVKVQWNVCHAFGNLFMNKSIALSEMNWAPSVFSNLLLLLQESANFKIRIQAASALAVPVLRHDFGESFYDTIHALVLALDSLDSTQVPSPSSFKYIHALSEQVTATTLHVIGLAEPQDYDGLQDFLSKQGTFLEAWIKSMHHSVVSVAVNGGQSSDNEAHDGTYDGLCSRSPLQSDKHVLPPKARIWYNLNDREDSPCREERTFKRKAELRKVIEVLIKMYRYGNQQKTALLFEQLLANLSI